MCSGWTSLFSTGQYIFCFRGTLSSSWSILKWMRSSWTAVYIFTGMLTRPNVIEPVQIERGLEEAAITSPRGFAVPGVDAGALLPDDLRRFLVGAKALEGGLVHERAGGPAAVLHLDDEDGIDEDGLWFINRIDEGGRRAPVFVEQRDELGVPGCVKSGADAAG